MTAVARILYAALLRLLAPAYALRLWLRGRAEPRYRHALAERFGLYRHEIGAAVPGAGRVWVHAVSLGETLAAAALIEALRRERPGLRLLLTHGTATGFDAGTALLREGDRQTWLPYDTPGAVRRFFDHFDPAIGVLMETEVWPALLHAAAARHVPLVLANARLSERSLRKGRRFTALLRPAVESLALVLAQSEGDAQRLRHAGARLVQVSGNLKYDLCPDASLLAQGTAWRAWIGRAVVLAANTREGEEALLLDAWRQRAEGPAKPREGASLGAAQPAPSVQPAPADALLLIVPRHPQRFDAVAELVQQAGLRLARRSEWNAPAGRRLASSASRADEAVRERRVAGLRDMPADAARNAQVWLGDSMGEMALYYASADIALLGGSFAPLGGHNLIEAAACGCPLVMGPSTFNFDAAAQLSLAAGASVRVAGLREAIDAADALLADPAALQAQRAAALDFARQHRGAAARMAARIVALLRA